MMASLKPSWIVMTAIASSVSAHWRPSTAVRLDEQALCHVRDLDRSTVDHRAADHDIRHDVFAISHHGGVGSDAGDDQVKPLLLVAAGSKLTIILSIFVHSIALPSSVSSPPPNSDASIVILSVTPNSVH